MKLDKILTLTITNSLILLIGAVIMGSCQKNEVEKTGLISNWNQEAGRSIASVSDSTPEQALSGQQQRKFEQYQDPKQILVYCKLNSNRPKSCYNNELNKILLSFSKNKDISSTFNLEKIKAHYQFEIVEQQFGQILASINSSLEGDIKKLVENRETFCLKNSSKFVNKCLTQYLNSDTFTVLNSFHSKMKRKMNGHEYLFFKNHIKEQLQAHLKEAQLSIEQKQSSRSI